MRLLAPALLLSLALAGCGGAGSTLFEDFTPRPATEADFESKSFSFSWLPEGNPVDPFLDEMDITFSEVDDSGKGTFVIQEEDGGRVEGAFTWTAPSLVLDLNSAEGPVAAPVPSQSTVTLEADESDGRIRLTSPSGVEAASDSAS